MAVPQNTFANGRPVLTNRPCGAGFSTGYGPFRRGSGDRAAAGQRSRPKSGHYIQRTTPAGQRCSAGRSWRVPLLHRHRSPSRGSRPR